MHLNRKIQLAYSTISKSYRQYTNKTNILNFDKISNVKKIHYSERIDTIPKIVQDFIEQKASICQPDKIQ